MRVCKATFNEMAVNVVVVVVVVQTESRRTESRMICSTSRVVLRVVVPHAL